VTASDAQVVLGATEALNEAAETGELRSMIETWLDPEFEYFPPPGVPEPGPYRGHDEMEAFYRYFRNQFDRIRISVKDVSETSGRVTYWQSVEVQGKGSGAVVADNSYCIATVRDGRLLRIVEDYDRTKALRRAGLRREVG
jgi:ketosteroid isomerase-like protein